MSDSTENQSKEASKVKMTNNEKNLVVSFIQFLRRKASINECNEEQTEALEVAIQCLEGAFDVSDKNYAFQPSKPLLEIFIAAEGLPLTEKEFPTPTQAEIDQANQLKEDGNALVKAGKFDDAIIKYNEAIKLNRDPIYFCNRAAAYCRLEQYDLAIQDCRTALALEPNYAKAYGRMGVALSCQNRYAQAVEAYKKALEIDPENESYKQNLSIAEDKLKEAEATFANNPNPFVPGAAGLGGGGFNLGNLMNNPQMVQMATQMISDPNVQNLMSQMMSSFMGPTAAGGENNSEGQGPGGAGLESFLRAGETMAQQMERSNPELVERLRRTFGGGEANSSENNQSDGSEQPPPPS